MYHQPTRRPTTPPPPPTVSIIEKPKERNWKLLVDPFLSKAVSKVYRYDGVLDPSLPELPNDDPRKTFKTITLPIELPVPKFKVCILDDQFHLSIRFSQTCSLIFFFF